MQDLEYRTAVELRAAAGRKLEGYAAVFDTVATIGGFTETIRHGSFSRSLAERSDILCLIDHDTTKLLGRTRSGSLTLAEDTRGLSFSLTVPDTANGRDIYELAQRGDVGGASFSFRATSETWSGLHREIRAADLFEVSIVTSWPAYQATTVSARSRDLGRMAARTRLRLALAGVL